MQGYASAMKVSSDLANCEAPTWCSSREKTERLGSCGEMVDSATMIARDSRAAIIARNLQMRADSHMQAISL